MSDFNYTVKIKHTDGSEVTTEFETATDTLDYIVGDDKNPADEIQVTRLGLVVTPLALRMLATVEHITKPRLPGVCACGNPDCPNNKSVTHVLLVTINGRKGDSIPFEVRGLDDLKRVVGKVRQRVAGQKQSVEIQVYEVGRVVPEAELTEEKADEVKTAPIPLVLNVAPGRRGGVLGKLHGERFNTIGDAVSRLEEVLEEYLEAKPVPVGWEYGDPRFIGFKHKPGVVAYIAPERAKQPDPDDQYEGDSDE